MDTHRVEIFDRANHNALILVVAHDFHLIFLPSEEALFDEYLMGGRHIEAVLHHALILLAVVSDAAAGTAERVAGADDDGEVADQLVGRFEGVGQSLDRGRAGHVEADFEHGLLEDVARFTFFDRGGIGADHLHPVLVKNAGSVQIHREIQARLPAEGGEQCVWALFGNYFL